VKEGDVKSERMTNEELQGGIVRDDDRVGGKEWERERARWLQFRR